MEPFHFLVPPPADTPAHQKVSRLLHTDGISASPGSRCQMTQQQMLPSMKLETGHLYPTFPPKGLKVAYVVSPPYLSPQQPRKVG